MPVPSAVVLSKDLGVVCNSCMSHYKRKHGKLRNCNNPSQDKHTVRKLWYKGRDIERKEYDWLTDFKNHSVGIGA